MEIFVDGGWFEIILAALFLYVFNYIFLRKYLLILYSAVTIIAPVSLPFVHQKELFVSLVVITALNSMLLVMLLWRLRMKDSKSNLFGLKKIWKRNRA